MSLDSLLVAKVVTETGDKTYKIGTAYPIRDGVIITAYHVIPDIDNFSATYLEWVRDDEVEKEATANQLTEILYQNKDHDIVIAKCGTPENIPDVTLCPDRPTSDQNWESLGYPKSGIDYNKVVRLKDPAGGTYLFQKEDCCEQHLETKAGQEKISLWQGMSGAPVFTVGKNQLTAIITKVPSEKNPQHKNRIYVASIAYLLENCEDFRDAVYDDSFTAYQQENRQRFEAHLMHLESNNKTLFKALPSSDQLLTDLSKDPVACVKGLKKQCEGFTGEENKKDIEQLFYLLLSQINMFCKWQGKHLHELNVSTRLLAELSVARLYKVPPQFADSDKLQGKHVLPASQTELGFDTKKIAEEQANTIAYALYKKWGNEGLTEQSLMENHQGYDEVNEALQLLREDDEAVFRFEINEQSEEAKDHPLLDVKVRDYIHQHLLPDLPIVLYGKQGASSFKDEAKLQTHVRSFVKKILAV